ncbi:MAG: hypothetical protein IJ705_06040 [Oscillospiraceae bacterium]|nr:hypothetical protein [Oscillospiraceae bacterium]
MADVLELIMILCFGVSWPLNIWKAWKARSAKGSSVLFYFFILLGYLVGLASKAIRLSEGIPSPWYIWFFYALNAVMVSIGIVLWFRNRALDRQRAAEKR